MPSRQAAWYSNAARCFLSNALQISFLHSSSYSELSCFSNLAKFSKRCGTFCSGKGLPTIWTSWNIQVLSRQAYWYSNAAQWFLSNAQQISFLHSSSYSKVSCFSNLAKFSKRCGTFCSGKGLLTDLDVAKYTSAQQTSLLIQQRSSMFLIICYTDSFLHSSSCPELSYKLNLAQLLKSYGASSSERLVLIDRAFS